MDDIIKALTIIWLIIQIADRLSDILDEVSAEGRKPLPLVGNVIIPYCKLK